MLTSLSTFQLCRLRCKNLITSAREFNRNSKISKWSLKGKADSQAVSDSVPSSLGFKCLIKPFIFTISFSGTCFIAATIWQYEEVRKRSRHYMQDSVWFDKFNSYAYKYKRFQFRKQIHDWWYTQTEGQRIALIIASINLFVFCLWRIPSCSPMMQKYFCASPAFESTCLPMLLSTFSHFSFMHLAVNMYVLYTFSTPVVGYFGKEQFLALYCSAGVVSSFASYVYKIVSGHLLISLGASGALMAILSSMCVQYPDIPLQIIFFPFFTFPASHAIKAVMALDLIGLLAKWKFFDHAAHLGGAVYGIIHLIYGQQFILSYRDKIFTWYHKIRERGES